MLQHLRLHIRELLLADFEAAEQALSCVGERRSVVSVGPEVEGATNVCVPFCGQPFWSVDPPSWFRLCAPRFLGILPELFRTAVVRDGHEALPRDLEEHHTQVTSKVTSKIQTRAVYLSPTVQNVRRAEAAMRRLPGLRFSFLFHHWNTARMLGSPMFW